MYPLTTANRYEQLTNLQDTLAKYITWKIHDENNTACTSNRNHRIKLHHQSREEIQRIDKKSGVDTQTYRIPTLLNDKIGNTSKETVSSVGTYRNIAAKNKLIQHKLTMIGDSFLRGIRENVELLTQ
jgi:hypothetical protein